MDTTYWLNILSTVSGILPVLAALYNYKKLDKVLKIAAAYFLISFLVDLLLEILKKLHVVNNSPVIHLFIIISTAFYTVIYHYAFFKKTLKKITLILSGITMLILIYNLIFIEGFMSYPSNANTIASIPVICFSLAYFYQLLNRQEFIHIEKQALFWINTGILIYYSINIFLFMLFDRLTIDNKMEYYTMINNSTNIISNILFTVGLLCKPQKATATA